MYCCWVCYSTLFLHYHYWFSLFSFFILLYFFLTCLVKDYKILKFFLFDNCKEFFTFPDTIVLLADFCIRKSLIFVCFSSRPIFSSFSHCYPGYTLIRFLVFRFRGLRCCRVCCWMRLICLVIGIDGVVVIVGFTALIDITHNSTTITFTITTSNITTTKPIFTTSAHTTLTTIYNYTSDTRNSSPLSLSTLKCNNNISIPQFTPITPKPDTLSPNKPAD